MTTRRQFLNTLGVSTASLLAARHLHAFASASSASSALGSRFPNPLSGIGVQLYMLRDAMRTAPEATLARIAELGFTQVEWWGDWSLTPTQLRAQLDANGLTAPAQHVDAAALAPERLGATLEAAQVMGHTCIIVPSPPGYARDADGWKRLAAVLSAAAQAGATAGITTGYHNHEAEFNDVDGRTPLEILLAETDASRVSLELDCYWAYKAGQDPIALIRRFGRRVTHLHLKDGGPDPQREMLDVGAGTIDWKRLLELGTSLGVRHAFVEHDRPAEAWASAAASRAYLRTIGY